MLKRYELFLKEFDLKLKRYFDSQKEFIKCKKGCTNCCEIGEYPFSRLEAEYLMLGFVKLSPEIQKIIKNNIKAVIQEKNILSQDRYNYRCPFLVNKECALYNYRGLTCRTFGLAYLDGKFLRLPACAEFGLNYSEIYSKSEKSAELNNPIIESMRIDKIFNTPLAAKFDLEYGQIRPLINWFL